MQRFRDQVDVIIGDAYDKATADCGESISVALVVQGGLEDSKLAAQYRTSLAAIYKLQYRAGKTLRHCVRRELDHG